MLLVRWSIELIPRLKVCPNINPMHLLTFAVNGTNTSTVATKAKGINILASCKNTTKNVLFIGGDGGGGGGGGGGYSHLSSPSPVMALSSAFFFTENWQCRIKLACLSSRSRTCFWSMFPVSETRYVPVCCAAARRGSAGKINSSKSQIPLCWGVFHFQAA